MVLPAVTLGLVPRHGLGYQDILFMIVCTQSDASCRGHPITLEKAFLLSHDGFKFVQRY